MSCTSDGKSLRDAIVYFQVIEEFLFIGFLPGIVQLFGVCSGGRHRYTHYSIWGL
jgi:hypothetical protein